jgi:hypothetical protein
MHIAESTDFSYQLYGRYIPGERVDSELYMYF